MEHRINDKIRIRLYIYIYTDMGCIIAVDMIIYIHIILLI